MTTLLNRRTWILVILSATVLYYFWTAMISSGGPPRIHGNESDHFNLLSRGFAQGHTYLDRDVPDGLRQAANPYDPALRQSVTVLHDASYFRGRYYLYFGPAPVVTLLLPFRLLTRRDLPLPYAVWLFCSIGFVALSGTFLSVQRRHFPHASGWAITAGLLALGGGSMVVALLRRPNVWELSGASGFCFFSASLYCLVRGIHASRPRGWALAGGFLLGLAVASRPTYILCAVVFALPWLMRKESSIRFDAKAVAAAALGCGALVMALGAYNAARFGNPFEFGQRYQLSGIIEGEARHFSAAYVPFNLHVYFLSALRLVPVFPFVAGIRLPPQPAGYGGYEYTFGVLSNLPFSWLGIGLLITAAFLRSAPSISEAARLTFAAVAAAALINAGLLAAYFGSCIRYMADFTPWIMLLAAWGGLRGEQCLPAGWGRHAVRAGALALAVVSAGAAAAGVVNFYDPEHAPPPRAYNPLARVLNFPVHLAKHHRWPDFGPREVAFTLPGDRTPHQEVFARIQQADRTTAVVFIEYLGANLIRFGFHEVGDPRPFLFSPAVPAAEDNTHLVQLDVGGRYSDYDGARSPLRVNFDGREIWDERIVSFSVLGGDLLFGRAAAMPSWPSFTGEIHAVRPIVMSQLPKQTIAGVKARVNIKSEMVGHAYPLLTTGRTKAGDLLSLEILSRGRVRFRYDHWGKPLLTSPEVPLPAEGRAEMRFWVPALAPSGVEPRLVVECNGDVVWNCETAFYPIVPDAIHLGRNPIGGSSCEAESVNIVIEDVQLPWPPLPRP